MARQGGCVRPERGHTALERGQRPLAPHQSSKLLLMRSARVAGAWKSLYCAQMLCSSEQLMAHIPVRPSCSQLFACTWVPRHQTCARCPHREDRLLE